MEKFDRLDALLAERDLDSVWFARPNSFAWLTGGSNVVDREADVGVAAAGYDGDRVTVVTDNVEADRLRVEELDDVDVRAFDWYDGSLADALAKQATGVAAADFDVPGFEGLDASPLRQPLTEGDIERYRDLGREAAAAVEGVCRELSPTDTERDAAAAVRAALARSGIESPVALVGGEERAPRYRHFSPTDAGLGGYALVSVTGERGGLHASLTRTVAFDPPEWLADRHRAATRVETTALGATRAVGRRGGVASSVFEDIRATYETVGHPDEWREHHQGGATGYAGREWTATPHLDVPVELPMAYAWNPTIRGAKSEDTVLVTDDGFEVLTATGGWPTRTVRADEYGMTLDRPGILTP